MKVRFTPAGDRQFLDVIAYILADRPAAARRFYLRALKTISRLETFPDSGRRIPEFRELPYREVLVSPYRFFYRVGGTTVWVVGVWHSAQLAGEPEVQEGA